MSKVEIIPYRGFGTPDRLIILGRVLHNPNIAPDSALSSVLDNVVAAFKRIETDTVPFVNVRAEFQGRVWEGKADDEGYFSLHLQLDAPFAVGQGWQEVSLRCASGAAANAAGAAGDSTGATAGDVVATAKVLTPPTDADFVVISDIDDTILVSHATEPWKMAMEIVLENAHQRQTFPGVPALYRALRAGPSSQRCNPIFYVSSSPWNLYDMLDEFLDLHQIPVGPLLLRDFDFSTFLDLNLRAYKLGVIEQLLSLYPQLRFILCGDSGQLDPETYTQLVVEYSQRILAVYIRDVTGEKRRAEVAALAQRTQAAGVDLLLSSHSADFARHAAAHGWISAEGLDTVEKESA